MLNNTYDIFLLKLVVLLKIMKISVVISVLLSPASIERGTIVVSGKNLCLSVTQFLMACSSETVEEIDTKLVPPRLQHLQMCSALRIFLQGQGHGQLVRSFNYSFPVCHSNIFDRHLCSFTCMFLISGACVANTVWRLCTKFKVIFTSFCISQNLPP